MVSIVSDPTNAWRRILVDTSRIADWARRKGTDEQKAGAQKLIESLNEFAVLFDLVLMPPNLAASINKPDDASVSTGKTALGRIAYKRGVAYDDCPHDEGTPEAELWRKQWEQAYNESNQS